MRRAGRRQSEIIIECYRDGVHAMRGRGRRGRRRWGRILRGAARRERENYRERSEKSERFGQPFIPGAPAAMTGKTDSLIRVVRQAFRLQGIARLALVQFPMGVQSVYMACSGRAFSESSWIVTDAKIASSFGRPCSATL